MVLWLVDRVQFLRFTVALLAMSFAAFVVFVLVPVAPPWLANHHHLLPRVRSLISLPSSVSPYYSGWIPIRRRRSPPCTPPIRCWPRWPYGR